MYLFSRKSGRRDINTLFVTLGKSKKLQFPRAAAMNIKVEMYGLVWCARIKNIMHHILLRSIPSFTCIAAEVAVVLNRSPAGMLLSQRSFWLQRVNPLRAYYVWDVGHVNRDYFEANGYVWECIYIHIYFVEEQNFTRISMSSNSTSIILFERLSYKHSILRKNLFIEQ